MLTLFKIQLHTLRKLLTAGNISQLGVPFYNLAKLSLMHNQCFHNKYLSSTQYSQEKQISTKMICFVPIEEVVIIFVLGRVEVSFNHPVTEGREGKLENDLDKKAGEEEHVEEDDDEEEFDDDEDLVPDPDIVVEYNEESTGDTEVGARQIASGQLL